MKKNLMKKAHEMTREIVEKYGDVDYRTQLGLCLSFLSQEGGQEMKIEGKSEKQIRYAEDCREKTIAKIEHTLNRRNRKGIQGEVENYKTVEGEYLQLTKTEALEIRLKIIKNITNASELIMACEWDLRNVVEGFYKYAK